MDGVKNRSVTEWKEGMKCWEKGPVLPFPAETTKSATETKGSPHQSVCSMVRSNAEGFRDWMCIGAFNAASLRR